MDLEKTVHRSELNYHMNSDTGRNKSELKKKSGRNELIASETQKSAAIFLNDTQLEFKPSEKTRDFVDGRYISNRDRSRSNSQMSINRVIVDQN